MAEVMLSLEFECERTQDEALAASMKRLRWAEVPGQHATWTCYFEASFIDEVRRIVGQDVRNSALAAKIQRWAGAHSLSSIDTFRDAFDREIQVDDVPRPPATETWSDAGTVVGPTSDVMLTLALAPDELEAMHEALRARGWTRLAGLTCSWSHRYDLGMFAPMEVLVARELRWAAAAARVQAWRAAWSLSSWPCTVIGSKEPVTRPYESWTL